MNPERCDADVYSRGRSLGIFDFTKAQAENYCAEQTRLTGLKHDWHFFAGRVHVMYLPSRWMRLKSILRQVWGLASSRTRRLG